MYGRSVRWMKNDLKGRAEIFALPLPLQDRLVDPARRGVVRAIGGHPRETLVVPEVEVGLGPVVGHEDFPVLGRRHRPRIDVEVGIKLAEAHAIAARLEKRPKRRGGNALPEGGHNASRDEDETLHDGQPA
jgi:hypothetical protein